MPILVLTKNEQDISVPDVSLPETDHFSVLLYFTWFTPTYVIVIYSTLKMDLNKITIFVINVELNHCWQAL
ncbi:hypothetical protein C9I98_20885 [Photobacterium sanctipauli]|uniref:Uncharacterized protein n=1 Tax=Photobacterium sanctipauli TaxID=1342794 RepID=A0A2T3NIK9_9GAMM|nr:hypothetical protein C9I98_20885 [Photobacterium sanctipauli]